MRESVCSGKYKLLPKMVDSEYENIRALAWLTDMRDIDTKSVERILTNQLVLTTGEIVAFVYAVDSLFNFVKEWIVCTDKLNVAALCKMHKVLKGEWDNTAGVLRQGYTSFGGVHRKCPIAIGSNELQEKMDIVQSDPDKKKVAKNLFKFILESSPFYEGNMVVAFMASECILVRYDVGYMDFSCVEKVGRLYQIADKIIEGSISVKDRNEIDNILDSCIKK